MTTMDALTAIKRRWYVLFVCVLLTAGVVYSAHSTPGVYSSTVDVYIVPPANTVGNQLGNKYRPLVAMAGLVDSLVDPDPTFIEPVDKDVSILSMAVYNGTTITLPNDGGQWTKNYDSPFLRISASGPNAAIVESRRNAAVTRVNEVLASIQGLDHLAPRDMMTTQDYPSQPTVSFTIGRPSRALVDLLILGVGLSATFTVLADELLRSGWLRRRVPVPRMRQRATA